MSKIAGDINAEMMKKAIHDSRAKLFAEIVGKTGSQQSVIDCAMQEIESLRQQLASRDAEIAELKRSIKFQASGNYDYQEELKKERDDYIKREVMLRDALEHYTIGGSNYSKMAIEALAATDDMKEQGK